jgi:hypothetical protein
MSAKKRFSSAEVPISLGGDGDDRFDKILRFEYNKWQFLVLALIFGILAFLSAMFHVDDAKGMVFDFKNLVSARGGLALGFLVLAGWVVWCARPVIKVLDDSR